MTKIQRHEHDLKVSSINPIFTFNYVQPEEYHFSHDSVFLARQVFEIVQRDHLPYNHILDLCSGCGIVGLDLLFHLQQSKMPLPQQIDFLEVQSIYRSYFEKNVETFNEICDPTHKLLNYNFINSNYELALEPESPIQEKYELLVCNPPYFRKDQGVLSKSEFKNRCRFFLDSDFKNLIYSIQNILTENGKAFVLLKSLKEHGISIEKEFADLNTKLNLKYLGLIRDTDFYQLSKN